MMSFRKWSLCNQRRAKSSTHEQQQSNLARRLHWNPRLESLEDRLVPAPLTVTNLNDSGTGSLRATIAAAHNGDGIEIQRNLSGTITLSSGELLLNKNITISGPGANVLSISGNHAARVFEVPNGSTDTISGLTITTGSGGFGGGIYSKGTLTVSGCAITGNVATYGGGIADDFGATLTLTNSTVSGNARSTAAASTITARCRWPTAPSAATPPATAATAALSTPSARSW